MPNVLSDTDITIMTLRRATPLKTIVEAIPKPPGAVPKNGLPVWYGLSVDQKLPVPKMPPGKVVFSRGKIGEDIHRLRSAGPASFDLKDPYCRTVSYAYCAVHDEHLAANVRGPVQRRRLTKQGIAMPDGSAVCTLREFNEHRRFLYNRHMDSVHGEMDKLNERARDDLTLLRVDRDVARRRAVFEREERHRESTERVMEAQRDELIEKKRLLREREETIKKRIEYITKYKEQQNQENAARARRVEAVIRQRVLSAEEMEVKRKITMVRMWRQNEKKRVRRMREEREAKQRKDLEDANRKWEDRIQAQNTKMAHHAYLLRLYEEDMSAGVARRVRRAKINSYNADLELQRIKIQSRRQVNRSKKMTERALILQIVQLFEKMQSGHMPAGDPEVMVRRILKEVGTEDADALTLMTKARLRMEDETKTPVAVSSVLWEVLGRAVHEFARGRSATMLRDVRRAVLRTALHPRMGDRPLTDRPKVQPRRSLQLTRELVMAYAQPSRGSVSFGRIQEVDAGEVEAEELKSSRFRPPTPVASAVQLAEAAFSAKREDLIDTSSTVRLKERAKLLESINIIAKTLSGTVSSRVQNGFDPKSKKVYLPRGLRVTLEFTDLVEGIAEAVVEDAGRPDSPAVRRATEWLTREILLRISNHYKTQRMKKKLKKDFYTPGEYDTPAATN